MKYPVVVTYTKYSRNKFSIYFKFNALGLIKDNKRYIGTVNEKGLRKIQKLCNKFHYNYKINNSYGTRSSNYRADFFNANKPILNHYYCAYCGYLIPKNKITVDHLYPIGVASKNVKLQQKLKKKRIYNINDTKNLVAACKSCNQKKGKKLGKWIRKGAKGRHLWYCIIRMLIRGWIKIYFFCLLLSYCFNCELANNLIYEINSTIKTLLFKG